MVKMHIGLDDTDSTRMGCTTYIAALLVQKLREKEVSFIDYPNLVRLNPNVPWKTRGNGALCLRIECGISQVNDIQEMVVKTVEENSDMDSKGTEPGIVFFPNEIPEEVETFAKNTIQNVVRLDKALRLIRTFKVKAVGFKNGRGLIGGLAAVGERLKGDHTYEFIAYRTPENRGTPRSVDEDSVLKMDVKTRPLAFNSIDFETGRILITPRGKDPILFGVRGESPEIVRYAGELVHADEPVERWVIFRTNQGTDSHLREIGSISEVKPHSPVSVKGTVTDEPRTIQGGHIIFSIRDETGCVYCAAYEPTGVLRDIARLLKPGDAIEAMGGVRASSSGNPMTINLEKIRVLALVPNLVLQNPLCPLCGKRTESMGKGQGFRCKKCGFRGSNLQKATFEVERPLKLGLYITATRSQRHLTKPFSRYGLEKLRMNGLDRTIPYNLFSGP